MSKLNFKDYSANYSELKDEEKKKNKGLKKQKKKENKIHRYKLNEDTIQQCLELKEYLEVLKNSVNSIDKETVRDDINKNLKAINDLKSNLLNENKKVCIFKNYGEYLSDIYEKFGLISTITIGMLAILELFVKLMFKVTIPLKFLLPSSIFMLFFADLLILDEYGLCVNKVIKLIIGVLPFNNRYSFVKTIRKLEKLETEYRNFSEQYEDYLKYLNSPEKSEVTENIIKGKEVKDLYLLEINKLVDKVKELPLGSDRDKYLNTIEKLTELYKREKERIILKHGRVHSKEELELEMSILKQIAYIEMQIDSSLYKNKNAQLLCEDYLTTLGNLDNTKDKKLERTLSLGK